VRALHLAAGCALLFGACLLPEYRVVEDGGTSGGAGGASGRGGSSAGTAGRGGAGGTPAGTAGSTGGGTAGSSAGNGGVGATGGTGGALGVAGTDGGGGRGGMTGTGGGGGSTGGRGGTTGTAGTGSAGRGGATGTAGTGGIAGGTAGRGGTTGTAGTGGGSAGRGGTTGSGGTTGGGGSTVAPDWLQSIAVVYQFDQPLQGQLGVEAHGNGTLHLEEQGTFLPTSDMTNFIEGYSVKMPGNLQTTTYFQSSTGAGLPSVFKTDANNSWTTGGWFRITNSSDQQWLIHTEGPTSFEQGGFYFYVDQNPGKLSNRTAYAYCRAGVKESTGNYKEVATDNTSGIGDLGFDSVVGNSWVHLTCRYNAATNELSILVGGVAKASNIDVTHQVASGPGPFMIGCNETWGCSLTGNVDEVFFATSALSDVDVHRIYACGIDGSRCRCNGSSYASCGLLQSAGCPMLPGCNAGP
jgi:hypothetical protein